MDLLSWTVPVLYHGAVLGACAYLLMRGVTHSFVALFGAGALLELIRTLGLILLQRGPGGFGDNMRFLPVVTLVGTVGMLLSIAAFIALTAFLLRDEPAGASRT